MDELPAQGFSVLSAGLAAMMGGEAARKRSWSSGYGADLTEHRSRPLSVELAAQADYLIGMTHGHVTMMSDYYPQLGSGAAVAESERRGHCRSRRLPAGGVRGCARQIGNLWKPLVGGPWAVEQEISDGSCDTALWTERS